MLGICFQRQSLSKTLLFQASFQITTLSAQVPHCLSCLKGSKLSVGEITREKNHLVLPGWQQLCRMTKGAVKLQVKDDNSLSTGTVTQKALRKTNSKTMAGSIVNSHVPMMPWHSETIRPKMQSAVPPKLPKHICSISSCHSLETHHGMVVRSSLLAMVAP